MLADQRAARRHPGLRCARSAIRHRWPRSRPRAGSSASAACWRKPAASCPPPSRRSRSPPAGPAGHARRSPSRSASARAAAPSGPRAGPASGVRGADLRSDQRQALARPGGPAGGTCSACGAPAARRGLPSWRVSVRTWEERPPRPPTAHHRADARPAAAAGHGGEAGRGVGAHPVDGRPVPPPRAWPIAAAPAASASRLAPAQIIFIHHDLTPR